MYALYRSIVVFVYRDRSAACSPDSYGVCFLHAAPFLPPQGEPGTVKVNVASFLHAAPFLPPQGLDAFDVCVVICLADLCISACFFKSIWNAWPTPKKSSENNSAALIESRAKFLHITHPPMFGYVDPLCPCSSAINVPEAPVQGIP